MKKKPTNFLHEVEPAGELQVLNSKTSPVIPQLLSVTTQALHASSPSFIPQHLPVTRQASGSQSPEFVSQALPTSMSVPHVQNSSDLVNILAEAINSNHLPTPEPAVFTGDPLKFKDWRLSFETLIDRKNIPKN